MFYTYYLGEDIPVAFKDCIEFFDMILFSKPGFEEPDIWIAGGAIRSYFQREDPADIDIYCANIEVYNQVRGQLRYRSEPIVETDQSTVFSLEGWTVDLVKNGKATAEETIAEFDFTVACAAVGKGYIVFHEDYFRDLATKTLAINKIETPLRTMARIQKYAEKGFRMPDEELEKLAVSIHDLITVVPLETPVVIPTATNPEHSTAKNGVAPKTGRLATLMGKKPIIKDQSTKKKARRYDSYSGY